MSTIGLVSYLAESHVEFQAGLGGDYQHMARLVNDVLNAKNE
jgi:hypothetical protein